MVPSSQVKEIKWLEKIEVRDSRTGYFIPVRYGIGVWPDGKIVGAPPSSSSASFGKCPNMRKCKLFSKVGMSEMSRNVSLSEIQAPGSILTKGSSWKLTPNELIHVHDNLKKWLFPIFAFPVTCFHIRTNVYRKPKWSVWSIWTYSTRWILKIVMQKLSFGRKPEKKWGGR